MVDYQELLVERTGSIASLILNRPQSRNAMNEQMGREVSQAVQQLNAEPGLRAVLVRGAGPAFAAGGDFDFIAQRSRDLPENNRQRMRQYYARYLTICELRVPTIAVLHGFAVGAGLCLALACDLRLLAADARLSVNFVRLGIHPGMGATYFLPRLVGPAKAKELLLTGCSVGADEALRIGLVNQVHPPEQLLEAATQLAQQIALGAPLAVQRTKASLERAESLSLAAALDLEASAQALDFSCDDVKEGIAAAAGRREPVFQGS